jgi:hypothetical protein
VTLGRPDHPAGGRLNEWKPDMATSTCSAAKFSRTAMLALTLTLSLLAPIFGRGVAADFEVAAEQGDLPGVRQVTNRPDGSARIASPVLSADGRVAAFGVHEPSPDRATFGWNRLHLLNADGSGLTEVDAYQTPCSCPPILDLSADGTAIVSSDGFRLRISAEGVTRELFYLSNGAITALRLTADGRTAVFAVNQDGALRHSGRSLARGIWAIAVDGSELRLLAGAEDVAAALGLPVEATQLGHAGDVRCCFQNLAEAGALDISDDGGRVVFGAHAGGQEYLFALAGDGDPVPLLGPVSLVNRVGISGDGATIAYDVKPLGLFYSYKEVGVIGAEGTPRLLATPGSWDHAQRLQLSRDGAWLFVSGDGLLIDVATGEVRQIGLTILWAGTTPALRSTALPAATMSADAARVLFTLNAYCLIYPSSQCPTEQLAILNLAATAPATASPVAVA